MQLGNFLGNTGLNDGLQQSGFALEITMDETFSASRLRCDFPGGGSFKTTGGKELASRGHQRPFSGSAIALGISGWGHEHICFQCFCTGPAKYSTRIGSASMPQGGFDKDFTKPLPLRTW